MAEQDDSPEQLLQRVPADSHVVAQTILTCARAEFLDRWPDEADEMAVIVCGRWVRKTFTAGGNRLPAQDAHAIDRIVNACYVRLDDTRIAAAERMFDELYKG